MPVEIRESSIELIFYWCLTKVRGRGDLCANNISRITIWWVNTKYLKAGAQEAIKNKARHRQLKKNDDNDTVEIIARSVQRP